MALRNIVQDGDPILTKKCRPVTRFDDRLAELLDDMKETLARAEGYGLAGPQVGMLRRVFISVDERDLPEDGERPEGYETKYLEFINPEILSQEGDSFQYEGCLSFPGRNGAVHRPEKVVARAQDRNGETFTIEATGMLARCICHESDHLDGVTILDRAEYFYEDVENEENEAEDEAQE